MGNEVVKDEVVKDRVYDGMATASTMPSRTTQSVEVDTISDLDLI